MLSRVALLLAGSAGLAAAVANQIPLMVTNTYAVDFNGNSGGFKQYLYCGNATSNGNSGNQKALCNDFINVMYQQVYEVDPAGRQVGSPWNPNFSAQQYGNSTFPPYNATATSVQSTAISSNGASFVVFNALFPVSTTIEIGNYTIPVTKNVLKISFFIESWPFQSVNNSLAVTIKMNTNGNPSGGPSAAKTAGGKNLQLTMGTQGTSAVGVFNLETYAFLDGSLTPSNTPITQSGNIYTVLFPYFSTVAFYDPTLYSSSASGTSAGLGALLALVAAMAFTASKDEEETA